VCKRVTVHLLAGKDDKRHTRSAIIGCVRVFNWSDEKNRALIAERGVSFEEAVFYLQSGGLLDDLVHHNPGSYPGQRIFVVAIRDYVFLVPYVEDDEQVFLKTIIPSRKFTKRYLGGFK
jgi:uncharacterized DUF497 family protein